MYSIKEHVAQSRRQLIEYLSLKDVLMDYSLQYLDNLRYLENLEVEKKKFF